MPHVVADNFKGAGYGYGYAFAQENICLYAEELVTLHGERASLDESRPLLGTPTPCVGREQELAFLVAEMLRD